MKREDSAMISSIMGIIIGTIITKNIGSMFAFFMGCFGFWVLIKYNRWVGK